MALYTPEVYIFINTAIGHANEAARELQRKGFDVRIVSSFAYDIIILFDASNRKLSELEPEILAIHGIANVDIIPAYSIKAPVPVRQPKQNATP